MKEQVPFTPQMKAFLARVRLNLNKLVGALSPTVLQYYVIHPQNIVGAMARCFNTTLATDEKLARKVIEKYLWAIPSLVDEPEAQILNARKLAIWIFRQSNGLTEEVVLYSPYDPVDRTIDDKTVARVGANFCHLLNSSGMAIVELPIILEGVGCPLHLSCASGNGVYDFNLTFEQYNARNARRLKWEDAMAGIKEIEVPEVGR